VALDESGSISVTDNTRVSGLSVTARGLSWTQTDKALPYPIMTLHSTKWPQFPPDPFGGYPPRIFWKLPPLEAQELNPVAQLVVRLTHMYQNMDSEMLVVTGLTADSYKLKIDGDTVGTFSNTQLAHGINLARYDTPMMEQADKVLTLVWHRVDVRFYGWRAIQVPLQIDTTPGIQQGIGQMLEQLDKWQNRLVAKAHSAAQPVPHHYELLAQ